MGNGRYVTLEPVLLLLLLRVASRGPGQRQVPPQAAAAAAAQGQALLGIAEAQAGQVQGKGEEGVGLEDIRGAERAGGGLVKAEPLGPRQQTLGVSGSSHFILFYKIIL